MSEFFSTLPADISSAIPTTTAGAAEREARNWHVLVVPATSAAVCASFSSFAEMQRFLTELQLDTDDQLFLFAGERIHHNGNFPLLLSLPGGAELVLRESQPVSSGISSDGVVTVPVDVQELLPVKKPTKKRRTKQDDSPPVSSSPLSALSAYDPFDEEETSPSFDYDELPPDDDG